MIVQRLRAVDQVITAFFNHIYPTADVCAASQRCGRLFLCEVLKCPSGYGLFMTGAESRTGRPILPKLRTRGVRAHVNSSTIRIAGGHP